jgi:hypothetical protein
VKEEVALRLTTQQQQRPEVPETTNPHVSPARQMTPVPATLCQLAMYQVRFHACAPCVAPVGHQGRKTSNHYYIPSRPITASSATGVCNTRPYYTRA